MGEEKDERIRVRANVSRDLGDVNYYRKQQ